MLISEAIQKLKDYTTGNDFETGKPINPIKTRDQILYGSVDQELTGIVTCIWPSTRVIKRAMELGYNLIVPHEALFWNHGDRTGWLAFNKTFQGKKALLDAWGGAVWRNHDYIHSKVPIDTDGAYVDGIFYGFAKKLGWEDYRVGDVSMPMDYEIPPTRVSDLALELVEKLGLNGTRIIGDKDATVSRIHLPMHLIGGPDDAETLYTEVNDVDCLLTMELTDFTTSEYIQDSALLGRGKAIITLGHFNSEEPGMEYMVNWIGDALGEEVPACFVPVEDPFIYITR